MREATGDSSTTVERGDEEAELQQTFADEEEAGEKIVAAKEKEEFPESMRYSLKVLLEQPEDEEGAEEEGEEGEEGEEEAAEDEGDVGGVAGEAGGEGEAEGTDEEAEEEEEEEEEINVTPAETEELGKSVDDALESILVDYEASARKSAVIQSESRYSLRRYLLEASDELDVDKFANDVARLVMNYDNLLDMEAIIINKAIQFLTSHYSKDIAENFLELLELKHGISLGEDEEIIQPIAIGASGGGGVGGGV